MTDALRDAELLARAAVAAAPEPGADQLAALAGYQAVRDRLASPLLTVSERVASYDWNLAELRRVADGAGVGDGRRARAARRAAGRLTRAVALTGSRARTVGVAPRSARMARPAARAASSAPGEASSTACS